MSTLEFLLMILPTSGIYFLAERYRRRDGTESFRHFAFKALEQMAEAVAQFNEQGREIFHACASYREIITKTTESGFQYIAGRFASNTQGMKAFWQDIDVGKATVPSYSSQREACAAVLGACSRIGLPMPLVVSSGVGLHLYWPLTREIDPETWRALARLLTACLVDAGLKIDPARASDPASVLRTVGAKRVVKGKERTVRVLVNASASDPEQLAATLRKYTDERGLLPPCTSGKSYGAGRFGDLERRKVKSALSVIDANDYGAWVKACACLVALQDQLGDDALAFWLTFSDSADESAKCKNDTAGTNPETMFARMAPDMTADAALGALMALAKETAVATARRDMQARHLTERGEAAVRHLVRFHPHEWGTLNEGGMR